ncbi:LCP family protein [Micromonospora sp. NPDC049559]|uniref:LCP family protein n=1 Tax=Micromonospora sp. NPDC049559 TaxID=3155923 RepID=UPI003418859A
MGKRSTVTPGRTRRSTVPRWAQVCTAFGALLVLLSGGMLATSHALIARYAGSVRQADLFGDQAAGAPVQHADIKGPLNILLVGIDPRAGQVNEPPRSDSIIIVHVNPGLDSAYLFSIPRDLRVDIPAFPKANYRGGTDKINAAMAYGSRVPGQAAPDPARGFELLSQTVSDYTGISHFDAGAIVDFTGFQKIVDAMGGVDMYIDSNVKSEHRQPDGSYRTPNPKGEGYIGPQATYTKGNAHLKGWQALDYVRQRYGLPHGDYDRQRHQQQFIKAMVTQAMSRDVVTNPLKLDAVLRAAGKSLIFNGRGNSIVDYAWALRDLRSDSIQMIKLPGQGIGTGSSYQGERLLAPTDDFFASLETGTTDQFLAAHPDFVNKEK